VRRSKKHHARDAIEEFALVVFLPTGAIGNEYELLDNEAA
jgi:hypothetical protein